MIQFVTFKPVKYINALIDKLFKFSTLFDYFITIYSTFYIFSI
jgi:hypothetical protein